ncbi:MAG: RNA polymerase sigma factor [Acidobacteriota bacterium]
MSETVNRETMSEEELLERVMRGDRAAFGEIFNRHRQRAYAFAYQYLHSVEDAKDVVQDAFIKVLQNLHRFDRRRQFGPWLLTIVRNQCIDHLRRNQRRPQEELDRPMRDGGAVTADRELLRHEVWRALQRLSHDHREIIFLKDYQGHTYAEIADILGIPLGTVMSRLHHARRNLAALLRGERQSEDP